MNHTYHNCLLESSHLENPSVLMGWWSGIDWDGQFIFRMNYTYIKVLLLLNYSENSPNGGYITIMPFCFVKDCQSQASFNDSTIKGLGPKILA